MLLTVDNGTLDLRTGQLRPSRREDLLTSRCPIAYDADAKCPRWDRFIAEVFEPNPDAAIFVQRFAGYSLTADTSAQCLLFAHGDGANGKGVLFHTLEKVLGSSMVATAPFDTFVDKRFGDAPIFALAGFRGKRAVLVSEGNENDRLAEGMIKQVTGGDRISARFLRGQFFEYKPLFKLWMSSNHKPKVRGTDRGIWRRIKLVPFDADFEGREDEQLEHKLEAELPGILAWAVRGCMDWRAAGGGRKGLGESASITEATERYRAESDLAGQFIAECCVALPEARVKSTALYDAYKTWSERQRFFVMDCRAFGHAMKRRSIDARRSNGARWYVGLGLAKHSDDRSAAR
jgi:putative DNA primase/helicase